jgi:hypothetical protein
MSRRSSRSAHLSFSSDLEMSSCFDAIETRSQPHSALSTFLGYRALENCHFCQCSEKWGSSNFNGCHRLMREFIPRNLQARVNNRCEAASSEYYFTAALSGEMYLATSMLAPTAASSQTAAIATKATTAAVDLISSFLRISAASAS